MLHGANQTRVGRRRIVLAAQRPHHCAREATNGAQTKSVEGAQQRRDDLDAGQREADRDKLSLQYCS